MTPLRTLLCLLLTAGLGACASSPPVRYFSLDDGRPIAAGSPNGVSVAIVQVNLPEIVDRPQLLVRSAGHRLRLSEHDRWAEPLRRQVPRLLARDLSAALDSSRVVALAIDVREFDIDFKVGVDVQRLEVISGQRVELDAVWRVEPRNGCAFFNRALVSVELGNTATPDEYAAAVDAERRVFRALAENIAAGISDRLGAGNLNSSDDSSNAMDKDCKCAWHNDHETL
jgi:uncharacterized lipoprotein YmbA